MIIIVSAKNLRPRYFNKAVISFQAINLNAPQISKEVPSLPAFHIFSSSQKPPRPSQPCVNCKNVAIYLENTGVLYSPIVPSPSPSPFPSPLNSSHSFSSNNNNNNTIIKINLKNPTPSPVHVYIIYTQCMLYL
jgi:hypothetical protein